jgi:DnaJ domain/Exodeoxyribonuclease X-like C-terminal
VEPGAAGAPSTLQRMAKRDPHVVLGVERGADATRIKAAWRRLARAHHPDLTGDDPAASQVATRRMAEINDAYASLIRERPRGAAAPSSPDLDTDGRQRRGGPPRPRPTRPVTGRVDTTATFRPRNQTMHGSGSGAPAGRRTTLTGNPPIRGERVSQESPRASTPTGPLERDRLRNFRRPKPPRLDVARRATIDFGKFHGHTLGEIAAFEPSYIDWVAGTVKRDPELVAAARVVQADLDARGIARRSHPAPARPSRSA